MEPGDENKTYRLPDGSNESTFRLDAVLPSLPLPPLDKTLERYIESIKPFVTKEELENTRRLAQEFQNGIGKQLHQKLEERAKKSRNWLEAWWEEFAYHRIRTPLLPFCSMDGVFPMAWASYNGVEDQIRNGSLLLSFMVQFWQMTQSARMKPTTSVDGKTSFSMSQFKRLYNTSRIPGEQCDKIVTYFKTVEEGDCPSHVVIFCHGRIFSVDALNAQRESLNPPEWATIFRRILAECENKPAEDKVAVLTCDDRTKWARNRKRLLEISRNNANAIDLLDSSVMHFILDDASPVTDSEVSNCNMAAFTGNKWADKSIINVAYRNGRLAGLSEHSAYDGIASITAMHYYTMALEGRRGGWDGRMDVQPESLTIQEITVDLDHQLKSEIRRVTEESKRNSRKVNMTRQTFRDFGKEELKKTNLHPDSFIQMALQLTYSKMHKKFAPCYETATTRGFYNGRTETVRACTEDCVRWVDAMQNPKVPKTEKEALLRIAVKKHDGLMADAREGEGCDRHLFGLYCQALEEGLPIPHLFTDPSYSKSGGGGNFVLSTSLTGYTVCGGGVAPMVEDGYGVFYCINPTWIGCTVSTFHTSKETSAERFFETLSESLREMRDLVVKPKAKSKL